MKISLKRQSKKMERKINKKKFHKRMWTPEKNLEIQFRCYDCSKKQNIDPGIIKLLGDEQPEFSFENELLCKYCFSNNLKPTIQGDKDIMFQSIGTFSGIRTGVVSASDKVYVENKPIP